MNDDAHNIAVLVFFVYCIVYGTELQCESGLSGRRVVWAGIVCISPLLLSAVQPSTHIQPPYQSSPTLLWEGPGVSLQSTPAVSSHQQSVSVAAWRDNNNIPTVLNSPLLSSKVLYTALASYCISIEDNSYYYRIISPEPFLVFNHVQPRWSESQDPERNQEESNAEGQV